ncbi:hypothetical protein ACH5RR_028850 [Cinchona calisaya]|uniref:Uncharacterized protein n=1 Tax=Cinchona calisaya TaxID=153742 RepID=A0ABD2YRR4_9GENT
MIDFLGINLRYMTKKPIMDFDSPANNLRFFHHRNTWRRVADKLFNNHVICPIFLILEVSYLSSFRDHFKYGLSAAVCRSTYPNCLIYTIILALIVDSENLLRCNFVICSATPAVVLYGLLWAEACNVQ